MAKDKTAEERRFFQQMEDRFEARLKRTVAKVRSEGLRDWSSVEQQFYAYGLFLEQEPGALTTRKESADV